MKDIPLNVCQLQDDRFNCCYVVTALQRHQMKAAVVSSLGPHFIFSDSHRFSISQAFTASLKAGLFRMRYDTPRFLENIEPQFKWIDPGEVSWSKPVAIFQVD